MKARLFVTPLVLCAAMLAAQTPATPAAASASAAPAAQTHSSDLGFSYSLPADWEVVDTRPMLPAVRQQVTNEATSEGEKKGAACTQVEQTARHGDPASVVVVVSLPFDCFGQSFTGKDLPEFASGVAEGLKSAFTISDPVYGAYMLGSHSFWIERASGAAVEKPEIKRTVEVACTVLKKGAVCWMALASDDAALQIFERGSVTLDGDAAAALVPANAFQQKK
jgi:hypothetical protein